MAGTQLNRLRHIDTEIFYRKVIAEASTQIRHRVTVTDGLRAAERLDRICELQSNKNNTPERLRTLLEERIAFAIEGFKRGGVTVTRRDVLELYVQAPESAGEFMPLMCEELAATTTEGPIGAQSKLNDPDDDIRVAMQIIAS